jgi:hypothetical protein
MFVIIKVVLSDHVAFVFFPFLYVNEMANEPRYTTTYVNVQHQKIERECDSNISHGGAQLPRDHIADVMSHST